MVVPKWTYSNGVTICEVPLVPLVMVNTGCGPARGIAWVSTSVDAVNVSVVISPVTSCSARLKCWSCLRYPHEAVVNTETPRSLQRLNKRICLNGSRGNGGDVGGCVLSGL